MEDSNVSRSGFAFSVWSGVLGALLILVAAGCEARSRQAESENSENQGESSQLGAQKPDYQMVGDGSPERTPLKGHLAAARRPMKRATFGERKGWLPCR